MFSSLKNWLLAGMALLFIAGWVCFFIFLRKYQAANEAAQNNKQIVQTATKQIADRIDTLVHAKHIVVQTNSPITTKELNSSKLPGWADTAGRSLDLGANYKNQVTALTQLTLILKDSLLKARVRLDAANNKVFFYQNKFMKLTYTPSKDSTQTGTFGYHYDAKLVIAQYFKRKSWLGAKHSIMDISAVDTNMTVEGVKHYQVIQDQPSFGLRIQAITDYGIYTHRSQAGLGAIFNVGRFSILGSYLFNLNASPFATGNKNIIVSTKYDLIRF